MNRRSFVGSLLALALAPAAWMRFPRAAPRTLVFWNGYYWALGKASRITFQSPDEARPDALSFIDLPCEITALVDAGAWLHIETTGCVYWLTGVSPDTFTLTPVHRLAA